MKVGEYEAKVKDYEKQIQGMQFNYALEGTLNSAYVERVPKLKKNELLKLRALKGNTEI